MKAYIAGVVASDGSLSRKGMKLKARDRDFIEAFASAVNGIYERKASAHADGPYWRVLYSNKCGTFDELRGFEPQGAGQIAQWLRGFFDGDGNAQLTHQPQNSPQSFARRVAFYSTDRFLLIRAWRYLEGLGLPSILGERKLTKGHKGKKPLFELRLRHSREGFEQFARLIGSSIARKQEVLDAIPRSYQPPGHYRRIQALGVKTRIRRRDEGGSY